MALARPKLPKLLDVRSLRDVTDLGRRLFEWGSAAQDYLAALGKEMDALNSSGVGTNTGVSLTYGSPATLVVGGANTDGVATSVSRSDHVHALPAFGTSAGTFCQGNDSRLSDARTPTGAAGGDLSGTYANPTVAKVNGVSVTGTPSNGQVIVASGATAAAWASISAAAAGSVPLYVPPSSAGAVDDEFDSTTLNAAWAFYDFTGAAARTPTTGPDPYTALTGATAVPKYDLHTNGRRSWLRFQITDSAHTTFLHKAWTSSTNVFVWARMNMRAKNSIGAGGVLALNIGRYASSVPANNNRVIVGITRDATTGQQIITASSNDNGSVASGDGTNIAGDVPEYFALHKLGSVFYPYVGWDGGKWMCLKSNGFTNTFNSGTPDFVAFQISSSDSGTKPYITFGVDFIREVTAVTMPPF